MKKIMIGLVALMGTGIAAFAAMDSKEFSPSIAGAIASTNTVTIRGTLEGVYVDVPAGGTCTVTVASREATLFTKASIVADAMFTPYRAVQTSAGASATFVGGTNDTANAWYVPQVMAGPVTVTILSQNGAAVTNTFTTRIIYNP